VAKLFYGRLSLWLDQILYKNLLKKQNIAPQSDSLEGRMCTSILSSTCPSLLYLVSAEASKCLLANPNPNPNPWWVGV
jgi:hypothetical protein